MGLSSRAAQGALCLSFAISSLAARPAFAIPPNIDALPPAVAGQGKFVSIDLKGVTIQDGHDVTLSSSPQTIGPSTHYRFDISGTVHGTGTIGSAVPPKTQLATALNVIDSGSGSALRGAVLEATFADTYPLLSRTFNGSRGPIAISGMIEAGVDTGIATFALKNFSVTFFGQHSTTNTIVFDKVRLLGYSADIIRSDFSVDAHSDLILFDAKRRKTRIALLNGSKYLFRVEKSILPAMNGERLPAGFSIVGVGDFNLDGNPDLLLSNAGGDTRATAMDLHKNKSASLAAGLITGPTLPAGFVVGGVGDFNLDGAWDIAAYNPQTLATKFLLLQQGMGLSSTVDGPALPAGFNIVSVADLNDDGAADLLLYDPTTRESQALNLSGTTQTGLVGGPTLPKGFTLIGASSFDNNRSLDLVIYNAKSRKAKFYLASGASFDSLPASPGQTLAIPKGLQVVGPR